MTSDRSNSHTTEDLQQIDNEYVMHPWASMGRDDPNLDVVEKAKGIYMVDRNGKRFIDGPGGMWCVNIGHGRQEIADAMAEQVSRLGYVSPWTASTEASVLLAEKLAAEAPGDLNTVFYTTGGSSAVDTALRFVSSTTTSRVGLKRKFLSPGKKAITAQPICRQVFPAKNVTEDFLIQTPISFASCRM